MNTKLYNIIMRRVYYAYVLKNMTHPVLFHGMVMLFCMIALSYFVSLGAVIQNIMQIKVGHLGVYFYNAFTNTEAWTLLLIGALIFTALSLRVKLGSPKVHKVQTIS